MKILTMFLGVALGAAFVLTPAIASAAAGCGGCGGGAAALAEPAKPEAGAKAYPLTTCIVTDEKLGEMGEPFVFVHQGQEIKLCCKSCQKKFDKAPETYLKKLAQAPAKK